MIEARLLEQQHNIYKFELNKQMNKTLYELTRTPKTKFLEGLIPGAIIGTYWRGAYPKSEGGLETAHEVLYKDWQSSPNSNKAKTTSP